MTPHEGGTFAATSRINSRDLTPAVELTWGTQRGELSPDRARALALDLITAADAADTDAALCRYLTSRGATLADMAVTLKGMRAERGDR